MFLQEYERIRRMGEGAFASVYKVRHAELGYIRALKVCNKFIEDKDDPAWKAFLSECKILLRIGNGSHPNIVRIYQPRLLDNRAVVEMDCVEGEPLTAYIRNKRFIPIEEFYRFARQIVGAMAYCHVDLYKFLMDPAEDHLELDPEDGRKYLVSPEKEAELVRKYGVVHNDLHSGNIIRRDYDGQYILLDFGLAIQDSHCVKSSSRFDGAIEYCSPEKLEQGTISTRSDVYALGILLYEVLAGRVPFPYENSDGSSPESARSRVYLQHLKEAPPSICELRKQAFEETHPGETYERDYPEQLENLIMKCLAKNPEDRFENARLLLNALEEMKEGKEQEIVHEAKKETKKVKPEVKPETKEVKQETKQEVKKAPKPKAERTSNGVVVNLIWFVVLCITFMIGGYCFSKNFYDESELIGAVTMGAGSLLVLLPWMCKWKSGTANTLVVLLWTAVTFLSIFFSAMPDEYFDDYIDEWGYAATPDVENIPIPVLACGGVGLIALCIAIAFSAHRPKKKLT